MNRYWASLSKWLLWPTTPHKLVRMLEVSVAVPELNSKHKTLLVEMISEISFEKIKIVVEQNMLNTWTKNCAISNGMCQCYWRTQCKDVQHKTLSCFNDFLSAKVTKTTLRYINNIRQIFNWTVWWNDWLKMTKITCSIKKISFQFSKTIKFWRSKESIIQLNCSYLCKKSQNCFFSEKWFSFSFSFTVHRLFSFFTDQVFV